MNLTTGEKIRILFKKNCYYSELSNRIGTTNQNLANIFKRDNFSIIEFDEIAEALNCEFEDFFVEKVGNKI